MRQKRLWICLAAALLCACLGTKALAAPAPSAGVMDAAYIREQATHLFSIGWERGEMNVTLIAPDGTRIPQNDPPAGVWVALGERVVIFRVDNAMPGLWKAELLQYDNGKIAVIVQKLIRPLVVQNVIARQEGNEIVVDFELSGEPGLRCDYDVYLTLDGQYRNGRLLASGAAGTAQPVNARCPAGDISSHTGWIVAVYAQCEQHGFIDFGSAASEPFSYGNPNAPGPVRNVSAQLGEGNVSLAWQAPEGEPVTGYLAVLFGQDGAVMHSVNLDADQYSALLPVASDGVLTAGVSAIRSSITGLPATVQVDTSITLAHLLALNLPEKPDASNGYVALAYDTGGAPVSVEMIVDERTTALSLQGGGELRVPVRNGINRVQLRAQASGGIWASQSRRWNIDMEPPLLRIYEDWDALVTQSKSLALSGNASGAQTLSVNGQAVPLERNGNFSAAVALEPGINILTVFAIDAAGNGAVYEARVTRKASAAFPWALAGSIAVAALCITLYALRGKRRKRL